MHLRLIAGIKKIVTNKWFRMTFSLLVIAALCVQQYEISELKIQVEDVESQASDAQVSARRAQSAADDAQSAAEDAQSDANAARWGY